MKRRLIVEVDCTDTHCGACKVREQIECRLFSRFEDGTESLYWKTGEKSPRRPVACLAAELHDAAKGCEECEGLREALVCIWEDGGLGAVELLVDSGMEPGPACDQCRAKAVQIAITALRTNAGPVDVDDCRYTTTTPPSPSSAITCVTCKRDVCRHEDGQYCNGDKLITADKCSSGRPGKTPWEYHDHPSASQTPTERKVDAAEQSIAKGTEEVREVLAEPILSWRFEEPVHFDGEGNVTMSPNQFNILLRGLQAAERQSTAKGPEPLVEAFTQSERCQGQRNEPTTERDKLREDLEEADGTIDLLRKLLADVQSSYEESSSLAEELLAAIGLDRHDFAEALPPAPSQEEMHEIFLDAERIAKATGYQVMRSKVVQALGHQWRATQVVLRDVLAAQIEWPDGALSDVATELEDKLRERAERIAKGP